MDFYLTKALVLNLSYSLYIKLGLIDDIEPLSETTFRRMIKLLQSTVVNLYETELDNNIQKLKGKQIIISIDTRWSSRGLLCE